MYKTQKDALSIAIQVGIPVLLWGSPGIGKTSVIKAVAAYLQLAIETIIASIREPSDFAGLPIVDQGSVQLAPPAWAIRLAEAGRAILFLDEISTAAPAVQAALLRVVLDRAVGDLQLPEGVTIVAAANPPEEAAGGWDLSAPLANRFIHLCWTADAQAWTQGIVNGWSNDDVIKLPENWEAEIPVAEALAANFISKQSRLLYQFPKEESQAGRAWASPRTWQFAARLMAACKAAQAGDDVMELLVGGCVGEGPAAAFLSWLQEMDLPSPEMLLACPTGYRFPQNRSDKVYAILGSVTAAVLRCNTVDRYHCGLKVMCEAARQGFLDTAYPHLRKLTKHVPAGASNAIPEMAVFAPLMNQANQAA